MERQITLRVIFQSIVKNKPLNNSTQLNTIQLNATRVKAITTGGREIGPG